MSDLSKQTEMGFTRRLAPDAPSGIAASPAALRVNRFPIANFLEENAYIADNQTGERSNLASSHDETTFGGRRPLRPPNTPLESENAPVYLRRA